MILWEASPCAPIAARVAVAGDFLPDWKPGAARPNVPAGSGWKELAQKLAPHFEDVAISFANCECTLDTARLAPHPVGGLGENISVPAGTLDYLAAIRARVVGVANNHVYDFGGEGVGRTRRAIAARGLTPLGAGRTLDAAPEVFVWRGPEPLRVGFWAAAAATRTPSTRAFAGVEPATLSRARQALAAMDDQGARFRIALLHAGCLRASYPAPEDLRLMDALARAGFDVVVAAYSHRISGARDVPAGRERPAFCFYGLGSIVSGYAASDAEREGLIVVAGFDARGQVARIEARSVLLDERGIGSVPPAGVDPVLERFRLLSSRIADGSCARLFYREISPGFLRLYLRDSRRAFAESGVRGLARKARRIRLRHIRRLVHAVLP